MPGIYKDLLRPLLFRGNAEKVHELAERAPQEMAEFVDDKINRRENHSVAGVHEVVHEHISEPCKKQYARQPHAPPTPFRHFSVASAPVAVGARVDSGSPVTLSCCYSPFVHAITPSCSASVLANVVCVRILYRQLR